MVARDNIGVSTSRTCCSAKKARIPFSSRALNCNASNEADGCQSVFDPGDIFTTSGVDFQHFTLLDKQRHFNDGTRL